MPGADPYADGLPVATSVVPEAGSGGGEPHAEGVSVATSALTKAGSVSTEAAGQVWSGAEHAVHAWCALALADQSGMAIPGVRAPLRGGHCRAQFPSVVYGLVVRVPKKYPLCPPGVWNMGSLPLFPQRTHPSCHTAPVLLLSLRACGTHRLIQQTHRHTCKLPLQLPACARTRNRTLLAPSHLLPASTQLTGLPLKHCTMYSQCASLPDPSVIARSTSVSTSNSTTRKEQRHQITQCISTATI